MFMDKIEKLEPRGLRNNNPLNIRHGQSKWQGTHPEKTDKDFVCYMSKAYGYQGLEACNASPRPTARMATIIYTRW